MMTFIRTSLFLILLFIVPATVFSEDQLEPIQYNNPDLIVDLGVGLWAWPLPMDYDGDGDLDLVVSCPDYPYSGTYFFENPGTGTGPANSTPIFKPAVRIADKMSNVQISYFNDTPIVSSPGRIYLDFPKNQYSKSVNLGVPSKLDLEFKRTRANQWKLVDWENDGDLDLIVGIGIWDDYGWDDAWDEEGGWKNGPLHGYVYLVENLATSSSETPVWKSVPEKESWPESLGPKPKWAKPVQIQAGGKPVDVYGMPSPNFADFDGDGDLDLICGEFMDGFTWFENTGTREKPELSEGVVLGARQKDAKKIETQHRIHMDLQMITPVAVDWDGDGDIDLISGDEDGRVAFIERFSDFEKLPPEEQKDHLRRTLLTPFFGRPQYFQQIAHDVKFGALITPVGFDWDGDGDEDIICGNTAGHIGYFENLGGGETPKFAPIKLIQEAKFQSGGTPITEDLRYQAGPKGSIQGPCEAKWGYSTISVADWNNDQRLDIIGNGIWGKVRVHLQGDHHTFFTHDVKAQWNGDAPKPQWTWWTPENGQIATQWRTTPTAVDWNDDGLTDLVMLDHEGYLAYYERAKKGDELFLKAPERIFKMEGNCEFDGRHRVVGEKKDGLLRLNASRAGGSGRRKLHFVDWDGDGRKDLLVNSENVNFLKNVRTDEDGTVWFKDMGKMDSRRLAGHTTSPTTVDWDKNGIPDLLVGAEDGRLYYKKNPRAK
ncbi:FG-GAP repeat domain-containing protein [Thalassoglobus polymorphus]|uniref:FG-GAP repeat protein n=1 Tax=Thalassoglobus polymorphus TaxID=2527994 RepID=A0A517QVG1_9PLAN|nr:VCBS repeat-containing protein [Thalassoglobus polymorphus]QDT35610.1 FG-GAP repeat protein [Thalassoglobus polymorphus]